MTALSRRAGVALPLLVVVLTLLAFHCRGVESAVRDDEFHALKLKKCPELAFEEWHKVRTILLGAQLPQAAVCGLVSSVRYDRDAGEREITCVCMRRLV